jgi:hypothetical protein
MLRGSSMSTVRIASWCLVRLTVSHSCAYLGNSNLEVACTGPSFTVSATDRSIYPSIYLFTPIRLLLPLLFECVALRFYRTLLRHNLSSQSYNLYVVYHPMQQIPTLFSQPQPLAQLWLSNPTGLRPWSPVSSSGREREGMREPSQLSRDPPPHLFFSRCPDFPLGQPEKNYGRPCLN